ncbi:sigma-54-dependent transcriptional regulator [Flavobacterium tructae]|uniref:sigma-54-dependent transcriptional regulator n=1 Tax=Flavobacterium tructae TaxID=1114873 RepID=UPI0035A970C3
MKEGSILIIDDNKNVLNALEILLQSEYQEVKTISNPNQLSSFQNLNDIDVVLLDMNFSAGINNGNEGLFWLKEIKKKSQDTLIIMMTAYGDIELAVTALKEGASDFILKPWENEKLLLTLKSANLTTKSKKKLLATQKNSSNQITNQDTNNIFGNSPAINQILNLVKKVAKTDANVLITGENGTGKELIARELLKLSERKNNAFVFVDTGSIPETLIESELFGHTKGSFTDAKEDRIGKFEAANGGTLFLDEIGNISLHTQSKLLSAIQNKTIVKLGSNMQIPLDLRLICATNSNLDQMVTDGLFREDLLYRINTIKIDLPPLREREEDILVLADFFLKKFIDKYKKQGLKISNAAQAKLREYYWPGNVRQLQHTIERAVILCEDYTLKPEDFVLNDSSRSSTTPKVNTFKEMEKIMIDSALQHNKGNHSAAAEQLGITRQTLYNMIKKINNDK